MVINSNILIKKDIKGLSTYVINQKIKDSIDKELLRYFKEIELQRKTFQTKLLSKDKNEINNIFKKYDKNNFWLSIVLFNLGKKVKIDEEISLLLLLSKLLGFSYLNNEKIEKIKLNIIQRLNIKIFKENNINSKIINDGNEDLINTKSIALGIAKQYNLNIIEEIIDDLLIFNYVEFNKKEYYFKGNKNTLFGKVSQKEIQKYIVKRNQIEKKLNKEIVVIPNEKTYEELIKKSENIFKEYVNASKSIKNYMTKKGFKISEFSFLTEQSYKPYFSDKTKLTWNERIELGMSYLILLFWLFIVALPISQVFYHSFNGMSNTALSVKGFKFSLFNFNYLFKETLFFTWFKNTIIIASAVTIINLIGASLLAYALSRFRFKGRKTVFISLIILNMLPSIAGLTSYIVLNRLMQESFNASPYIIMGSVYAGTNLLGFSFVIKNYLDTISKEIDEAAKIDGASNIKIFSRIVLPLIAPILGVIALQSFIIPFVDIMLPKFFLSNREQYTLPLGLSFLITNPQLSAVHYGAYTAGALLVAVPMTLVYFAADFFMKQNKMKGAIKG